MTRRRRLRFKNVSGETMPPGAFFGIHDYVEATGSFEAKKWTGEVDRWGFNGQAQVEDQGFGWFERNQPEYIAYATDADMWTYGTQCGPQKDLWYLTDNGGGFRFYGEFAAAASNPDSLATGIEYIGTDIVKINLAEFAAGGETALEYPRTTATCEIRDYDSAGDIVDTGRTIPVKNPFENLSFSPDVHGRAIFDKIEWHLLTADCPN